MRARRAGDADDFHVQFGAVCGVKRAVLFGLAVGERGEGEVVIPAEGTNRTRLGVEGVVAAVILNDRLGEEMVGGPGSVAGGKLERRAGSLARGTGTDVRVLAVGGMEKDGEAEKGEKIFHGK